MRILLVLLFSTRSMSKPYEPPQAETHAADRPLALTPEDRRWLNADENGRRKILMSLGITLLCLHGPFSWLLVISYPWNSYRLTWLMLWPILPGLFAGLPFHPRSPVEFSVMGFATLAVVVFLTYIGTKGIFGRIASAVIALAISVPTAMLSYTLFRA